MNRIATFEAYLDDSRARHLNYAKRLTRNSDDAEDLLQEAKIRALRALDGLSGEGIPEAWFRQIVKNCFLDIKRYRSRRPVTTSLDAIQDANPNFDIPDGPLNSSDFQLMDEEYSAVMKSALARLTAQQRALVLGALSGLTCLELSKMFQCGATTVRTRLHRAHRSLRRHLLSSQLAPTA